MEKIKKFVPTNITINEIDNYHPSILLSNLSILIVGDSHAYQFMNDFIKYACGWNWSHILRSFIKENDLCPGLVITPLWSAHCSKSNILTSQNLEKFNITLVNCGHHYAGTHVNVGPTVYGTAVNAFAELAMELGYTNRNLVWMESVASPIRYDKHVCSIVYLNIHSITIIFLYSSSFSIGC
jgi:hypothetical protein